MPISISMIIVSSQLIVAVADGVPKFDISRSCKLDVAATAGLTVDQSIKSCMRIGAARSRSSSRLLSSEHSVPRGQPYRAATSL